MVFSNRTGGSLGCLLDVKGCFFNWLPTIQVNGITGKRVSRPNVLRVRRRLQVGTIQHRAKPFKAGTSKNAPQSVELRFNKKRYVSKRHKHPFTKWRRVASGCDFIEWTLQFRFSFGFPSEQNNQVPIPNLGPPGERIEYGYPFFCSVVNFSRGTLPKKVGKQGTTGGPRNKPKPWVPFEFLLLDRNNVTRSRRRTLGLGVGIQKETENSV